jgi:quinol monooxygenase YgiN
MRRDSSAKGFKLPMITISADNHLVTIINVFSVDPANQLRLMQLLRRATEGPVVQAQGFVSASLHRSIDGTKVTMYAQWRTVEDYQAMRANPRPLPYLQEALTIATFEPGIYEVADTFLGPTQTG